MKKTREQRGITLVALIITIVVLLILAVVAITAIQNDGILGHAGNATNGYTSNQLIENGLLNDYESLLNQYGGVNGPTKEDLAELDLVERYILGAEKTGRSVLEIANVDFSTYSITSFIDDDDTIADASTTFIFLTGGVSGNATNLYVYAKYNNKVYKLIGDGNTLVSESVEMVYKPEGREGQTVKYDSNNDGEKEDWVIITDRVGKVEIVSKDVAKDKEGNALRLTLGYNDPEIKGNLLKYLDLNEDGIPDDLDGDGTIEEGGTDLDEDGTIEQDNEDIAIASYNNAITTINNYCKSLVTATDNEGVRSVGGTNNNFTPYHSTNYDNWGSNIIVDVASGDAQYELDFAKMSYYGINNTTEEYWVASRNSGESESIVNFGVGHMNEDLVYFHTLWYVNSTGVMYKERPSKAFRPVVINPSGI